MSGETTEVLNELIARLDPKARRSAEPNLRDYLEHVPMVVCADGFKMSVQASGFHYCSPRASHGGWYQVEVGFPSERVEALMPYIDGRPDEYPTETVYGYVPLDTVAEVIVAHGGFARASGKEA